MLKAMIQDLMRLSTLTGVQVHTEKDGQKLIHACTLKLSKAQLGFEHQHKGLKSVVHFAKNFKPGPLAIVLTGKGIITKKIDKVQGLDPQVLNQVLPNANPDHFYLQHYSNEEYSFISAIRRNEADELMAAFREEGFMVLSLSLDAFVLDDAMELKEGQLEEELLPAYAAAFQVLLGGTEGTYVAVEQLRVNRAQAFARAKLKGIGLLAGLVLMVLLLLNFVGYSYYSEQVKQLSAASNSSTAEIGKLRGQEKEIGKKTELIKAAGWTGGLNYAYLCDALMACMPAKMSLQEFSINPADEELSRARHEMVYQNRQVKVRGACRDASMLNNWIFAIRAKDWVEGCKILNYAINPDDGSGSFAIAVQLKAHEE
ncbi:hypothetical protein [Pedobacter heparinus]|uniref:Fimbrial assembly family protein n=1 Tax=Pedobacter heparinus (strain ATCC 13125 / DSM 2366 / CIP 104194 / JCM 7457 / NBRC 12017 / NCIMB 9290 / NRRL B-14731 / HIM 762-3) TaxID=485917 RepID=C6Y3P3_PEDHD|nr:hypothetical protein [Pedobacter heparinus]ACU03322.1 hypothetical protein Phep_1104 [Pedobacter heparinus DSM 2366]